MLASTKRWLLLAGLGLAACESEVQIEPADGGSGEGAGNNNTGSSKSSSVGSTTSASGSTSASGAGGAPDDCENVPTYLQNLLDAAAECHPDELVLHCQFLVDGYCCPVVVEDIGSPSTQAYLDFLHLSQEECPALWDNCNTVDCAQPEPGHCVEEGVNMGKCHGY